MTLPLALLEHEQVVVGHDAASGLRAVVAIHSTALGPALGGTRFVAYADLDAAMDDALALARAMTYKNALAGLPHGGGKGVILGDPQRDKTPEASSRRTAGSSRPSAAGTSRRATSARTSPTWTSSPA